VELSHTEMLSLIDKIKADPAPTVGDRVRQGDKTLPWFTVAVVLMEWIDRGDLDSIMATPFKIEDYDHYFENKDDEEFGDEELEFWKTGKEPGEAKVSRLQGSYWD